MARAPTRGPLARLAGFLSLLRLNGFAVGVAEGQAAAAFLAAGTALDRRAVRLGLKALLCGGREQWERFDELFEAWWAGRGMKQAQPAGSARLGGRPALPKVWDAVLPGEAGGKASGAMGTLEGDEPAGGEGEGRLVASRREAQSRTDLRRFTTPEERAEAERVAERLARAIRHRLSRRRRPSRRGREPDLRRSLRRSMAQGGEPLELLLRERPSRPAQLVLLLDVSGSMQPYARPFLAFLRGLLGQDLRAEAFLFHTRLVRITEALREPDPLRAMDRLTLLAEGFGGGTRIAACLKDFNDRHARSALGSRSVVLLLSDGYDTDEPEALAAELARLKRRARRLVWLNPLLGWHDYAPVARGMAAALPYVDRFATAHSLASLAALEPELARL